MSRISLDEIDNLPFWLNYFGCSYLNLYDEEEEASVSELMEELCTEEVREWWEKFTGWDTWSIWYSSPLTWKI